MLVLSQLASFILIIFFAFLILFFSNRAREGRTPVLRPIAAFKIIQGLMARAVESGQRLHISLGTGGIADQNAADTLAGLTVLEHLSPQAAASDNPPIVTMSDPAVMLLAQNTLRKAYGSNKQGAIRSAAQVRWISPEPAAYAGGVMSTLALDDLEGNVMIGHFGDEYLLMGEAAHHQGHPITTVAGASGPNVLPYVYATSPQGLWGEDIYAAGAYLSKKPGHIGSLLAQDTVRWVVGLAIVGSVILKAFGLSG